MSMTNWGKKNVEETKKESVLSKKIVNPKPLMKKQEIKESELAQEEQEEQEENKKEEKLDKKNVKMGSTKFNLDVFNRFRKFSSGDAEMNKLWVNRDYIISTKTQVKSLLYRPASSQLFKNEFGISNLQNFINLLSTFDDIEMSFDMPHILFKSKNSILTYKSASKESFKQKIESNNLAYNLHEISKKLIKENKYFKFSLDYETLGKIIKIGNNISYSSQNPSILTIFKDSDDDNIHLQIHNPDSENTYNVIIEGENPAKISEFQQSINISNLLEGDWDMYLFDGTVEHAGQTIPIVWSFLIDVDGEYEMILVYKNKQE